MLGRSRREKGKVYFLNKIVKRMRPVAERYGADSIHVSGSYGRIEARPNNDIDLLLLAGKVQGIAIGSLFLDPKETISKEIDMITDKSDLRLIAIISKDAVCVYGRFGREEIGPHQTEGEVYLRTRHHHHRVP